MKFQERSFTQNTIYRPRPFVHWNEALGLLIIATPWGKNTQKEDLIQLLENYITSAQTDQELTSPFQSLQNYDKSANALRSALLLTNDSLLKSKNKTEFVLGYEIFVGHIKDSQMYFANIGHPHVLLSRESKNILPLYLDLDHSLNLSPSNLLPALPSSMLGVSSQLDLKIHSIKIYENDKILLLSHSWVPENLINLSSKKRSFENIVKNLMSEKNQPFWIGLLEF